ncbi:oxidoreductase [Allokutzneria albata]|uniref:Short-chain dehydrogenase n=1 Tax=Allokutzneria albata TaxID=211114 RepID=A0A1H0DH20_ALLAB|nr:oxidoreductase [Allokutzneria albata]SDN69336.1 Short-chain dehydrogenase [Allokutzneria albata]
MICLVTGASSGIGHATALELLRAGHVVYAVARRLERMDDLREAGAHTMTVDITDEVATERVVRTILEEQHRIDVVVNNAGIAVHGAVEDVPLKRARELFEVNLFGAGRLTQLVLPSMRAQRSGTIVNISSVGGEIALPLGAWYYASKHALEAFSDSLRQEVGRFGIGVVVVQPGLIATEIQDGTAAELRELSGQGAYARLAEAMAARTESGQAQRHKLSDPSVVARAVLAAVTADRPKSRYAVGYLAKPLLWLNRLFSDRRFDKIATRRLDR